MSSGQKARTRDNFPRMKDRARARRNRVRLAQEAAAIASIPQALRAMTEVLQILARTLADAFRPFQQLALALYQERSPMKINEIDTSCFSCGYRFDAASGVNTEEQPDPGSLSLCLRCAAIGVFDMEGEKLVVRKPTPDELAQVGDDVYDIQAKLIRHREANPWPSN